MQTESKRSTGGQSKSSFKVSEKAKASADQLGTSETGIETPSEQTEQLQEDEEEGSGLSSIFTGGLGLDFFEKKV